MRITTMGIDAVEAHVPGANGPEAVISIHFANGDGWDNGRPQAQLSRRFYEVLRVAFDDCGEHMRGHPNSTVELTEQQAFAIVAFACAQAVSGRDLIVHCGAGMSRSVAVAAALDLAGIGAWTNKRGVINPTVRDLVLRAAQ
jgi:predicted protein tyrosine phosphatase